MIKGRLILQRESGEWQLSLMDRDRTVKELAYKYGASDQVLLDISITKGQRPKSKSELGYFYAEILPRITDTLNEQGYDMDENSTYHWLKLRFLGYNEIPDPETGEIIKVPYELKGTGHDVFHDFVNKCAKFGETTLNITFQTPEEYKQQFIVPRI